MVDSNLLMHDGPNVEMTIVKQKPSTTAQRVAGYLAVLGSIASLIMIQSYALRTVNFEQGWYLGGLNWTDLTFNYHPVLMTAGFIFCGMNAILSFRLLPLGKPVSKNIHVALHVGAVTCISIGLAAVYIGNSYTNHNNVGYKFPNFYSLHSFIGLSAIVLYFQNFILGSLAYLVKSFVSLDLKKMYMPNHKFLGILTIIFAGAAILTGIVDIEGGEFGVCTFDAENGSYADVPRGCKVLSAFGMTVLTTIALFLYAVIDLPEYYHIKRPVEGYQ